jgi:hypothetical protein
MAAMTSHVAPPIPGYLTYLFVGLVGVSAAREIRALHRRLAALEARDR